MSYERVLNALVSLGLTRKKAEIYLYLATRGPQEAWSIAENLKLNRQQIGLNLQSLQDRKIVILVPEHRTKFSAAPFEKTMTLLMKASREETQRIEKNKKLILSDWHSLIRGNSTT